MLIYSSGRFLSVMLCFLCAGSLSAQKTADSEQELPAVSVVELKVLDSEGKPITKAGIHVGCWFQDKQYRDKYQRDLKTNENGVAKIKLLPTLERIRFWVSAKDHVTLFNGFEPGMLPNLPEKITLQLQRSKSIGGKVVDDDGNPISGAVVEIKRNGGGVKLDKNDFSRLNTWISEGEDALRTNENGEWFTDQRIPDGDDLELSFIVKHPDFLSDEYWESLEKKNTSLKHLKDRKATFTLANGVRINGSVVDDTGKPVKDALVVWGDRPYSELGSQEIKTNSDGKFKMPALKSEPINVTIVAKGWMPQLRKIDLSQPIKEQTFKLTKGKKLHLKFVDPNGKPIPKVYVSLKKWRGIESLYNTKHSSVKDTQIPNVSDENGEFIWDWAPNDEVEYQTGHPELARYSNRKLTADETIQTIELSQPFSISGTVVDAKTNQPIDEFAITPVTCYSGGRGIAQATARKQFRSSNFKMNVVEVFAYHDGNVKFEIQSLHYRVKTTEEFTPNSAPFNGVIAMEPVPPPTGIAVNQQGEPIVGASIFVCTKDNGVVLNGVDDYFQTYERIYKSNDDGTFRYPAQISRMAITVATPNGYAEKYLDRDEAPGKIVLKPWASVKGKLFQAGKPVAGASISVSPIRTLGNDNPQLQDHFHTTTDSNGEFIIEKVPPVPCSISSQLSPWDDYPITSARSVSVRLEPGKTHEVNLGNEGIQIVGKVKLKGDAIDHIQFRYGLNTLLKVGSRIELESHLVNPAKHKVGKQNDYMMKLTDNLGSTVGYETHFVKINPDGKILINGVSPGDYRFLLKMYEPPSG